MGKSTNYRLAKDKEPLTFIFKKVKNKAKEALRKEKLMGSDELKLLNPWREERGTGGKKNEEVFSMCASNPHGEIIIMYVKHALRKNFKLKKYTVKKVKSQVTTNKNCKMY